MSLLCTLFGHRTDPDRVYGHYLKHRKSYHAIDGIGREHVIIDAECSRCGESYEVGMVHLKPRHAEEKLREKYETVLKELEVLQSRGEGI